MLKKSFTLLLITVFVFFILLSGVVSAYCVDENNNIIWSEIECNDLDLAWIDESPPASSSDPTSTTTSASTTKKLNLAKLLSFGSENLESWWKIWQKGEEDATKIDGEILKYFFLALIVILVYSALTYAKFPEQGAVRTAIAIVVGFLATWAISPTELVAILKSYTALGATLMIFFPIMILGFFTLVVSSRVNPIGIMIQKILWVIYSVYLFMNSGASLAMGYFDENGFIYGFFEFFGGKAAETGDAKLILTILAVTSIAIFIIAVYKNDFFVQWIAKEMRDSDIEKYKDTAERSRRSRETDAEMTRS